MIALDVSALPRSLGERTVTAFALRTRKLTGSLLWKAYLSGYAGSDPSVLAFCLTQSLDLPHLSSAEWSPDLEVVARSYAAGVLPDRMSRIQYQPAQREFLNLKLAERILKSPELFPHSLLVMAEGRIRFYAQKELVPVAAVAESEGWFAHH